MLGVVGSVPVDAAIGSAADRPAEFVDEAMVDPAEQAAAFEVGEPTVFPRVHVVRFALAGGPGTTREAAATVAIQHGAALRPVEQPLQFPEVEDLVVFVDEDAADLAGAAPAPHRLTVQGQAGAGLAESGGDADEGSQSMTTAGTGSLCAWSLVAVLR